MSISPAHFRATLANWQIFLFLAISWLLIIAASGLVRPLFPSNELRYIGVAWEMWYHHSFLLPIQGGLPYSHKPPLLFWMVHLGWWVFGVQTWWARLVPELFALACLPLTYIIAKILWPQNLLAAKLSPVILMGMLGWLSQLDLFKFDILVSFFVLLSLYFYLRRFISLKAKYSVLMGLSVGLGILAKGPVILLFILPTMILGPFFLKPAFEVQNYYRSISLIFILGIVIALTWAIPAACIGGKFYAQSIFWHQSAGRIQGDYGGLKPWYIYLVFLFWLLFPWTLWVLLWKKSWQLFRNKDNHNQPNFGLKMVGLVIIPSFLLLSLIPMKSERYIIPLLPWFALGISFVLSSFVNYKTKRLDTFPIGITYIFAGLFCLIVPHYLPTPLKDRYFWVNDLAHWWFWLLIVIGLLVCSVTFKSVLKQTVWLCFTALLTFIIYDFAIIAKIANYNNLQPMASHIARIQKHSQPVALYQSDFEFDFFGRLTQPLVLLETKKQLIEWANKNQNGWVVTINNRVFPKRFVLMPVSEYTRRL